MISFIEMLDSDQKDENWFYEQQLDVRLVPFVEMSISEKSEYSTASKRDNSEFIEL